MPNKPITSEELAEWREAREKATQNVELGMDRRDSIHEMADAVAHSFLKGHKDIVYCGHTKDTNVFLTCNPHDAQFYILAANQWTRMIDEIERLRAECDNMIDENNGAFWTGYDAQSEKRDKSTNPYEDESRLNKQWGRGWDFSRNTDQLGDAQKECSRLQAECDRLVATIADAFEPYGLVVGHEEEDIHVAINALGERAEKAEGECDRLKQWIRENGWLEG